MWNLTAQPGFINELHALIADSDTSMQTPNLERSPQPSPRAEEPDGSAANRGPQGQTSEAGKWRREERKDREQGQLQWKEMDSIFVSPLSSCQPCSPCPMGGCHGDRRPHVLGASFLVKGAYCSCVKPPSVCPSARDGGCSFTPLTKTQSTPCCVEVQMHKDPHKS